MTDIMTLMTDLAGGDMQLLTLGLVFVGILIGTVGVAVAFGSDDVERRYKLAATTESTQSISTRRYAQTDGWAPAQFGKFVAPTKEKERLAIRRRLIHAGYRDPNALFYYYLIRTGFGLLVPAPLLIGTIGFAITAGDFTVDLPVLGISASSTIVVLGVLVLLGFYLPPLVLSQMIKRRQRAIREGFPNALDLMQVAVQAGLGFDAALARIADDLRTAHTVLADEFRIVVEELRAGKPREQVLQDLGDRTGLEEVTAFATVMNQSIQFGTSISDALDVYAKEMRHKRMMRAEEMANKLPVKMSVVMTLFLLPTLFIIFIGPIVIRMIRVIHPMMEGFN